MSIENGDNKAVLGLIGLGGISQSQHLPNLVRSSDVWLKTVCDLDQERIDQTKRDYKIPRATTDYRDLLADASIQAVVIATKPDTHVSLTIDALRAGKHVYVEKPLAQTVTECRRVVEEESRSGKMVVIGFNRRMAPAAQRARQILNTHGGACNIHYRISDSYYIWGKNNPPGTRMFHEVCHVIDLIRYLAGSEVATVYCVASRPDDEILVLTFRSGCIASITSSGFVEYDMPKERMEIILPRGGLIVEDYTELQTYGLKGVPYRMSFGGHTHPLRDDSYRESFDLEGAAAMQMVRRLYHRMFQNRDRMEHQPLAAEQFHVLDDFLAQYAPMLNYMMDKGWSQALDHFARCILHTQEPVLARPKDGLMAARIIQAAIESRQSGQIMKEV